MYPSSARRASMKLDEKKRKNKQTKKQQQERKTTTTTTKMKQINGTYVIRPLKQLWGHSTSVHQMT